jgi:hypothetical protein
LCAHKPRSATKSNSKKAASLFDALPNPWHSTDASVNAAVIKVAPGDQ